jgi:hypothetical protein
MEIVPLQINVFVNRDGQEIIVNLPFAMELMQQYQLFVTQKETVFLQIIVLVLAAMMDPIANIQFVMESQSNFLLFVLSMEIAFLQIIVFALLVTQETIVTFQFALELHQMKQHPALLTSEGRVFYQIIALAIKAIVDQIVKTIFVLESIPLTKMFVQVMEIAPKRIIVNANLHSMETIVNFQIFMILFKIIAKLDVH